MARRGEYYKLYQMQNSDNQLQNSFSPIATPDPGIL
jgi:hypothetical protein